MTKKQVWEIMTDAMLECKPITIAGVTWNVARIDTDEVVINGAGERLQHIITVTLDSAYHNSMIMSLDYLTKMMEKEHEQE